MLQQKVNVHMVLCMFICLFGLGFELGGHTSEMFSLLQTLPKTSFTPRCYVLADSDAWSKSKIETYETDQSDVSPNKKLDTWNLNTNVIGLFWYSGGWRRYPEVGKSDKGGGVRFGPFLGLVWGLWGFWVGLDRIW